MADDSTVLSALAPWKTKRFRDYELSWIKATESLMSTNPLVEVRPNRDGSRWMVYNKATDKIAIFFHAAVWSWASPPETGNFVPEGKTSPEGTYANRILSVLSRYLETSYAINTEDDPSFYRGAKLMEDHVTGLQNFNKYKKPRRTWQQGESEFARRRFILSARLVVRRTPLNSKEGQDVVLPYKLHPWIQEAVAAQKNPVFMPNPEMPAILDYVNGKLKLLRPTHYRYFHGGDIVWFSFALSFDVNNSNWMPEYKPLDFIRVGALPHVSENRLEYLASDEVGSAYRSLGSGDATLLDDTDEQEMPLDDDTHDQKLKRARDLEGDEVMSDGELSDLSDKSAYSAAHAGLEIATKRLKIEDPIDIKPHSKKMVVIEEKRRVSTVKGKAKA